MNKAQQYGRQSPAFFLGRYPLVALIWMLMPITPQASATTEAEPADTIEFVHVTGAVQQPTQLTAPVQLRTAIEAAGGFGEFAYPFGTVLLRKSHLRSGMTVCLGSATELLVLQLALSGSGHALELERIKADADRGQYIRVPVSVSPGTAIVNPQSDLILVPGDILHIPVRPTSVAIVSRQDDEVTKIVNYQPGWRAEDYLNASDIKTNWSGSDFSIYYPNGEEKKLNLNLWHYEPEIVPPGSIIVSQSEGRKHSDAACLRI